MVAAKRSAEFMKERIWTAQWLVLDYCMVRLQCLAVKSANEAQSASISCVLARFLVVNLLFTFQIQSHWNPRRHGPDQAVHVPFQSLFFCLAKMKGKKLSGTARTRNVIPLYLHSV